MRRHDNRQAFGPLGAYSVDAGQLNVEHLLIEKQQSVKRLILRAGGDLPRDRQMGQERFDLDRAHLRWVLLAVKNNEPTNPLDVAFLGS